MQIRVKVTDPEHTEVALEDPGVFTAFDAVVEVPEHLWVLPETLLALAGPLAEDAQWRRQYDAMVAYAASKGWTDDDGRIRAHVRQSQP